MVFTTKSNSQVSDKEARRIELKRAKALHKKSNNKEFASQPNFVAWDTNTLLNQTRNYRNIPTPVKELLFRGNVRIV